MRRRKKRDQRWRCHEQGKLKNKSADVEKVSLPDTLTKMSNVLSVSVKKRRRRKWALTAVAMLLTVASAAAAKNNPASTADMITGPWNPVTEVTVNNPGLQARLKTLLRESDEVEDEVGPEGRQFFPHFPTRANRQHNIVNGGGGAVAGGFSRQASETAVGTFANGRILRGAGGLQGQSSMKRVLRLPHPYRKLNDFESKKTSTAGTAPDLSSFFREPTPPTSPDINSFFKEPTSPEGRVKEQDETNRRPPDYSIGTIRRPIITRRIDPGIGVSAASVDPRYGLSSGSGRQRHYFPTRTPNRNGEIINTRTPRPLSPFRETTPGGGSFYRPSTSVTSKSASNRVSSLNTDFFNLPAIRPTPGYSSTPFSTAKPSRVQMVKKLVKKFQGPDGKDVIQVINTTTTDLCAGNKDIIECGGEVKRRGSRNVTTAGPGNFGGLGDMIPFLEFIRGEIWVIPILSSTCLLVVILLIFEIYLIAKSISRNPSRRHLFLGQMLMLGLVLCCCMAVCICLKPTSMTCAVLRIGLGLSYTVIYSTLLVKLVFLISLNSGVYLPATYQCLLLCFAISIQLVIGIQWLVSSPADVTAIDLIGGGVYMTCKVTFHKQLLGLLYVHFLLLVVIVLAFKSRGVRENYREAMYIGLTMGFTVCIFGIWMIAGFISDKIYGDLSIACGLVACAAITFVIMFMPKGRQLSAMGREGVYSEDRADVVYEGSSTQSTGSGGTPSPSFFPIKPGKLVEQFRDQGKTDDFHFRVDDSMAAPPLPARKHCEWLISVVSPREYLN
jgi:hypothetical protein